MSKTAKIKYQKGDDYPSFFITGVWGQTGTTGQIVMNTFFDALPLPEYVMSPVDDKEVADIYSGDRKMADDSMLIREFCCRLIMDPTTAHSVGTWLINEAKKSSDAQ